MKFTKEHYSELKTEIVKIIDHFGKHLLITKYETGQILNSEYVRCINTRFIYDMYWLTDCWKKEHFLQYLDKHLKTALFKVLKDLDIKLVKRF
jgi:hypothetical protein